MKKIILSLVALLCLAAPAQAIDIDWGLSAGLNLTKMKFTGTDVLGDNLKNKAGFFIGPKVNVGLAMGFGLDGALLYNQRTLGIGDETSTAHSLEIPINVKYTIGLGGTGVYLATGPQFGFNIGDKKIFDGALQQSNMVTTWNVGAGVKLFDHLDLGLGYNFGLGKLGESIVSTISPIAIPIGTADDYKANTFTVQVTYYF